MLWKLAPALATGNTFVYKPSECTPITADRVARLLGEILPPGVVNVLPGDAVTGAALASHPDVAKVSFTGSTASGIAVAAAGASSLTRLTLELGGKSPLLVFADANLRDAVTAAMAGNFANNGQVCSNCTRVYVEKSVREEFLALLVEETNKMVMGDPLDVRTDLGPLMTTPGTTATAHHDRVLGFVARAKRDARATLLCGGDTVDVGGGHHGCYLRPTVFACRDDDMELVREEIFGPVMAVLEFEDEEDVVKRANDTKYGLAAGVMTNNLARAHRVAKRLQAGYVWINNYNLSPVEMPFGPYKMSGYGKELGLNAIDEYTRMKTVYVEMGNL